VSTPFSTALALTPDGDGYSAVLGRAWTVGPKAHGGLLLALCAAAARTALDVPGAQPLVVSASYLAAPDPGPVHLAVEVRKRGRSVSLVDVELRQGERVAVRAAVTLGVPDSVEPLREAAPDGQPAEPPADAIEVAAHPTGDIMNLAAVCDLHLDRGTAAFAEGRVDGEAEIRLWVRPHGEDPDVLFALLAGDVSPPVTLNIGRPGWAPTVQLTALVRAHPAPGWLRVRMSSRCVGGTWFDEDATVTDSAGTLVCQSRQLAMVPRT
jgi:hypothetical protein